MKCPMCEEHDLVIGERQGVEIHYCPKCRGTWLDRGELDNIIRRSIAEQGIGPVEDEDDMREQDFGGPDRKRSWLSDLFD